MKSFLADLRFGARMLRKSPGFAVIAIAVLALGLLRSLPMRDPERVVMIWEKNPALGGCATSDQGAALSKPPS